MLDLNILEESVFPIKLINGEVISLKKPTQKMIILFSNFDKKLLADKKKNDIEGILKTNADRLLLILNHNKENYKVTHDIVNEFTPNTMQVIMQKYSEWVQEMNSNPN